MRFFLFMIWNEIKKWKQFKRRNDIREKQRRMNFHLVKVNHPETLND